MVLLARRKPTVNVSRDHQCTTGVSVLLLGRKDGRHIGPSPPGNGPGMPRSCSRLVCPNSFSKSGVWTRWHLCPKHQCSQPQCLQLSRLPKGVAKPGNGYRRYWPHCLTWLGCHSHPWARPVASRISQVLVCLRKQLDRPAFPDRTLRNGSPS